MSAAVPMDDLPANLVPPSDMPGPSAAPSAAAHEKQSTLAAAVKTLAPVVIPGGAAMRGMQMLDRGAYKAGGAVTDAAAKVLPPQAAAGLGYATDVGIQSIPAMLGGVASKAAASPALEAAAKRTMQSALKPSTEALRTGKAAKAVDTMLEEGVSVTKGGVEKLRAEIERLNDAIKDALDKSTASVDKQKVVKVLDDLKDRFMKQVTPQSDLASIRRAAQEFLDHPLLQQISQVPVKLAQELKQGTYRALGSKAYGELKGAETEAQKALARGLKEEIAVAEPGVASLNAAESRLLNAKELAERRVLADANKNPLGLGALNPKTLGLWLADRSPLAKSLLARALYSGSEAIPSAAGQVAGGGLGLAMGRSETARVLGLPPFVAPPAPPPQPRPLPGRDAGLGMTGGRG